MTDAPSSGSADSLATHDEPRRPIDDAVAATLVAQHRAFLSFLRKRVESDAAAEEILQAAFVKAVEKGGAIRDDESAVAWFYRVLRNAVVDHHRRRDAARRALEKEARAQEVREDLAADDELQRVACACVLQLVDTLKDDYARILREVDVGGRPVVEVAGELGITANNAGVRLHRARQALKKRVVELCATCATHGCVDCTCGPTKDGAPTCS